MRLRLIAISEYWHYLDRPETFVRYVKIARTLHPKLIPGSIGKSDDELGRMLEVLRFWFTKDLVCHVACICYMAF